ncbi:MAG: putative O-glycosylation ligase, exosortase A system-associated [Planctomycetes bacterium]|nr:putative O-glycosylation ligase, exosortase A system-associated [Planctomycetota bacterium]
MRDPILTLIILALLPACYFRPYVGLLTFTWLAYMRAQDLCWGFARTMRFSFFVSLALILGFLVNERGKALFLRDLRCWIIFALPLLSALSISTSITGFDVWVTNYYIEYVKVIFIALITTTLLDTRNKLRWFCWTIALSLGFYGIKTGIFGVLTGGQARIMQGPGGMLEDNNDFALALVMSIPIMFYLGFSEGSARVRSFTYAGVALTMFTVVLTHSRGGFLSMVGVLGMMIWRSKRRMQGVAVGIAVGLVGLAVVPQSFIERIGTLENPNAEASSRSRLEAWGIALQVISEHPWLGVGMRNFELAYAQMDVSKQVGGAEEVRTIVVHNSYLQVWAEQGSIAFALYLTLLLSTFWMLGQVRREARRSGARPWILDYARMFEASLFGFVIGSTFLNRATFDLMYHIIVASVVFKHLARREMRGEVIWEVGVVQAPREVAFRPRYGFGRRGALEPALAATTPRSEARAGFGTRAEAAPAAEAEPEGRPGFGARRETPGGSSEPPLLPETRGGRSWAEPARRPRWGRR